MESSKQKETGKAKNDHEKTFERVLKKIELTWREAKRQFHGEKGMAALSFMNRRKEINHYVTFSFVNHLTWNKLGYIFFTLLCRVKINIADWSVWK